MLPPSRVETRGMRRGQSIAEFAICLPFLVMLMLAMLGFGEHLHRRQILWQVARAGALEVARFETLPGLRELEQVRRRMSFVARPHGIQLDQIGVAPSALDGWIQVEVHEDVPSSSPARLFGVGSLLTVKVQVPVGSRP